MDVVEDIDNQKRHKKLHKNKEMDGEEEIDNQNDCLTKASTDIDKQNNSSPESSPILSRNKRKGGGKYCE